MDKERFFKDGGFRTKVYNANGVKFELRELSLSQRRAILDASAQEYPSEVVAALCVSMSCPDFNESDVERLIEEVRPEILLAASADVFELSGMTEAKRDDAKKQSGSTLKENLRSFLPWHWGKRLES